MYKVRENIYVEKIISFQGPFSLTNILKKTGFYWNIQLWKVVEGWVNIGLKNALSG